MKISGSILTIFLIFCGSSLPKAEADEILCSYREEYGSYTCFIISIGKESDQAFIVGNHTVDNTDVDVKVVEHLSYNAPPILDLFDGIFCEKFSNLEQIDFYNVEIGSIKADALKSCPNLVYFELTHAKILKMPELFFIDNPKLLHLRLGSNQLSKLPENIFKGLADLEELVLSANQFKSLPDNLFKPLPKLKVLDLIHNQFKTLNSVWFDDLVNLEELRLDINRIMQLPANIFVPLKNLMKLRLSGNQLSVIESKAFGNHENLMQIDFSGNRIAAIDEAFFDKVAVAVLNMEENVCSQEKVMVDSRKEMKEKLINCTENYADFEQPEQPESVEIEETTDAAVTEPFDSSDVYDSMTNISRYPMDILIIDVVEKIANKNNAIKSDFTNFWTKFCLFYIFVRIFTN